MAHDGMTQTGTIAPNFCETCGQHFDDPGCYHDAYTCVVCHRIAEEIAQHADFLAANAGMDLIFAADDMDVEVLGGEANG